MKTEEKILLALGIGYLLLKGLKPPKVEIKPFPEVKLPEVKVPSIPEIKPPSIIPKIPEPSKLPPIEEIAPKIPSMLPRLPFIPPPVKVTPSKPTPSPSKPSVQDLIDTVKKIPMIPKPVRDAVSIAVPSVTTKPTPLIHDPIEGLKEEIRKFQEKPTIAKNPPGWREGKVHILPIETKPAPKPTSKPIERGKTVPSGLQPCGYKKPYHGLVIGKHHVSPGIKEVMDVLGYPYTESGFSRAQQYFRQLRKYLEAATKVLSRPSTITVGGVTFKKKQVEGGYYKLPGRLYIPSVMVESGKGIWASKVKTRRQGSYASKVYAYE